MAQWVGNIRRELEGAVTMYRYTELTEVEAQGRERRRAESKKKRATIAEVGLEGVREELEGGAIKDMRVRKEDIERRAREREKEDEEEEEDDEEAGGEMRRREGMSRVGDITLGASPQTKQERLQLLLKW